MESVRQVSPQDLIGWIDHSVSFLPFCAEKIQDLWFFFVGEICAQKNTRRSAKKKNREKARIGVSRSAKENLSRPANYFRNDCNKKKTNQPAWLQSASAWYGVHGQQQERKPSYFLLLFVATVVYGASISFFFRRISRRIYALRLFGFACLGKARFKIDVCAHKPVPEISKAAKTALVARVMPVVTSSALENRRE